MTGAKNLTLEQLSSAVIDSETILPTYIDKNMPDEHPEKCVGKDAEAVAKYIYDAFYSVEARIRNHPVRVEVARSRSFLR